MTIALTLGRTCERAVQARRQRRPERAARQIRQPRPQQPRPRLQIPPRVPERESIEAARSFGIARLHAQQSRPLEEAQASLFDCRDESIRRSAITPASERHHGLKGPQTSLELISRCWIVRPSSRNTFDRAFGRITALVSEQRLVKICERTALAGEKIEPRIFEEQRL
ncbi:MAG TPA: hypothetical protein VNF27_07075, partial [Candidatus Binataceae bacterium]|nr:hypothetical protein [Candidatus Binataceae bacterium]